MLSPFFWSLHCVTATDLFRTSDSISSDHNQPITVAHTIAFKVEADLGSMDITLTLGHRAFWDTCWMWSSHGITLLYPQLGWPNTRDHPKDLSLCMKHYHQYPSQTYPRPWWWCGCVIIMWCPCDSEVPYHPSRGYFWLGIGGNVHATGEVLGVIRCGWGQQLWVIERDPWDDHMQACD